MDYCAATWLCLLIPYRLTLFAWLTHYILQLGKKQAFSIKRKEIFEEILRK
jgi:hypothetical protein